MGETSQHLPHRLGREGLEPEQLQPAHRPAVHPAREHVHGQDGSAGELHRRHALRRRRSPHEARPRRQSRRIDGLGSRARASPSGPSRRTSPSGRAPSSPRAAWCSTAPWMAGSRPWMPDRRAVWRFKVDSGIIGQPISYRGPDGHQYIAVLSGVGGWSGAVVSGPVDPRDGSAALGMVNVMSDLPKYTHRRRDAVCVLASALSCCCWPRWH